MMPQDEQQKQEMNTDAAEAVLATEKDLEQEVVNKIAEAHNILVALSGDPSVDEMAAAIGLSIYLDKIGKKATAIYSGATPNALEFLNPEETFDTSADVLQDFVIALNKEKADHLRYKIDGDYVKIFITPFAERIAQDDLEFYYGDYNVDLVIALDVMNGIDLDAALREHGRIMHDAAVINVTTGKPGKFGEIEWSDMKASSVSEMLAELIYKINHKIKMEKEEATAFLTGIVAATNRFANARTTAATMRLASKLIESGANQQLVAKNITSDVDNELYSLSFNEGGKKNDADILDVNSGNEEAEVNADVNDSKSTLLDDLKAAEASLAGAGAEIVPEAEDEKMKIENGEEIVEEPVEEPVVEEPAVEKSAIEEPILEVDAAEEPAVEEPSINEVKTEKVIPVPELTTEAQTANWETDSEKYGRMLKEALAGGGNPAAVSAPVVAPAPEVETVPEINYAPMPEVETMSAENINAGDANVVSTQEEILPPPPAPIIPTGPVMPDGSSFKIPGM